MQGEADWARRRLVFAFKVPAVSLRSFATTLFLVDALQIGAVPRIAFAEWRAGTWGTPENRDGGVARIEGNGAR